MSANQAEFPIATMAYVLGVSVPGYHAWREPAPSAHAVEDKMLLKRVRTVHLRCPRRQPRGLGRGGGALLFDVAFNDLQRGTACRSSKI
jgi:hypothetical protein